MSAGNGIMSDGDTFTTTTSGWPFGGATGWKSRHALAVSVYSRPPISTRSGAVAIEEDSERQHLHAVPHPATASSTAQQRRMMLTVALFIAPF
jgi:hypothetical protein